MSEQRRKKKNYSSFPWAVFTAYMLAGAACGAVIMLHLERIYTSGEQTHVRMLRFMLLFMCMYGAIIVQIVIHEAGHLLFGLATGYRFNSFRIFNLMWIKENSGIRFRRMSLSGTGGQCLMNPPDLTDGKMPVMLYNYGGVILNTVSVPLFVVLALLCPAGSFGRPALLLSAVIGLSYAFVNGFPLGVGLVNNDGKNALDASRSPEALRAFWIQMKANEMTSKGARLREMPDEWFVLPSDEAMKNSIIAVVGALACSREMDAHRFEQADRLMAGMLSKQNGIVGLHRAMMNCDRIFVRLIRQNSPEVVARLLSKEQKKIMKANRAYPSVLRTEYALALLRDGDLEKAAGVRKKFEQTAASYPYPVEIEGERELMDIAEEKVRSGRS